MSEYRILGRIFGGLLMGLVGVALAVRGGVVGVVSLLLGGATPDAFIGVGIALAGVGLAYGGFRLIRRPAEPYFEPDDRGFDVLPPSEQTDVPTR